MNGNDIVHNVAEELRLRNHSGLIVVRDNKTELLTTSVFGSDEEIIVSIQRMVLEGHFRQRRLIILGLLRGIFIMKKRK